MFANGGERSTTIRVPAPAASDIIARDQAGSQTSSTSPSGTPSTDFDLLLHLHNNLAGHRACRRGQCHLDFDVRRLLVDIDPINQAEVVNVDGNFRIVNGPDRVDRPSPSIAFCCGVSLASQKTADNGAVGELRRRRCSACASLRSSSTFAAVLITCSGI